LVPGEQKGASPHPDLKQGISGEYPAFFRNVPVILLKILSGYLPGGTGIVPVDPEKIS